ncbi:MAG: hypothetical protein IT345_15135 [Trueperaceae bacterium]|nr:hypothetical protein [Trueperaceae bacterium]
MRGQLPKAYLRLDPNIDRAKADTQWAFIRLLCEANRQPRRGRFKNRAVFDGIMGRAAARKLIEAGDAVERPSGEVVVPGWDEWQEGDVTVAERQRRIRQRRESAVIPPLHDRIPTPEASAPSSTTREGSSKALGEGVRQQGSKAPAPAPHLLADELPSDTDSATLACRLLMPDGGRWLNDREYVHAWEDMDRRFTAEWVQAELTPAYAAVLASRGKVLAWDLKRMVEHRCAERARAEDLEHERRVQAASMAESERLRQKAEAATEEERKRAAIVRRAVGLWVKARPTEPIPTDFDELNAWLKQHEQAAA